MEPNSWTIHSMKSSSMSFSELGKLLKAIVLTIDVHGLKRKRLSRIPAETSIASIIKNH